MFQLTRKERTRIEKINHRLYTSREQIYNNIRKRKKIKIYKLENDETSKRYE